MLFAPGEWFFLDLEALRVAAALFGLRWRRCGENPESRISPGTMQASGNKRPRASEEAEAGRAREVVVPSTAAWYRDEAVSSIERHSLPEFFDGSSQTKTPETFLHMRNLIVSLFREQPGLHLSVTECRRHLAADVGSVMRLHQFLEHWGLINYNASSNVAVASASRSGVVLDGPSAASVRAAAASARPATGTSLPLRASMASGGGDWTPQQTMALLDALEQLGDGSSWDEVATAVGRPIEDCIGHFLALPIEEPYALEALPPPTAAPLRAAEAARAAAADPAVSVAAAASDPTLCQLALLAAAVGAVAEPAAPRGEAGRAAVDATATVDATVTSLRAAARAALLSVQSRAAQLEQEESGQMVSLLATAVDTQLRRMEIKLVQLDEMQSLLQREREQLDRMRHQVYADRISLEQRRSSTAPPLLPWVAVQLQQPAVALAAPATAVPVAAARVAVPAASADGNGDGMGAAAMQTS